MSIWLSNLLFILFHLTKGAFDVPVQRKVWIRAVIHICFPVVLCYYTDFIMFQFLNLKTYVSKAAPDASAKVNACPICVILLYLHTCPVNLICGLASLLLRETFETFPILSLPPRFLSSRNGTAGPLSEVSTAPNLCFRVLQQKTTTWKVFFSGLTWEFNTGLGSEQRGGTVWADGLGDEIALVTEPISPSSPSPWTDGRFFFFPDDVTVLWQTEPLTKGSHFPLIIRARLISDDEPHPLVLGAPHIQVSVRGLSSAGRCAVLNWLFPGGRWAVVQ